ncbi:MAG: hypothetical protein M3R13_09425 [Armatimonadota bacterium]|nr:hypothetical protein [Armatimonadota bacterium]
MRKWFIGALALVSTITATAQDEGFDGVLVLSHGYYLDHHGKKVSLVGKKVPYHGVRISLGEGDPSMSGDVGTDGTLVYQNNHGTGSYIVSGLAMPSALDDVLMSGGAGATWQFMTMGVNANITNPNDTFLIRWIGYANFTPGLGAGVSAFSNPVLDFGGPTNLAGQQLPGTFMLTFDLRPFGLISPVNQLYFAQQFRVWNGNPNAPFRPEFDSVFSLGFPSPGQSQASFYFDFEPNGIYDETEVDEWPAGSEANLLLAIEAMQNGITESFNPSSFSYSPGTHVSGELVDLWDTDNLYVVGSPGIVFSVGQSPLRLVVTSRAASLNATNITLRVESKATSANLRQTVEFYNYTTSTWVTGTSRQMTTADVSTDIVAPGTPNDYIEDSTRNVRARISYQVTGPMFAFPWRISWDQTIWRITRP